MTNGSAFATRSAQAQADPWQTVASYLGEARQKDSTLVLDTLGRLKKELESASDSIAKSAALRFVERTIESVKKMDPEQVNGYLGLMLAKAETVTGATKPGQGQTAPATPERTKPEDWFTETGMKPKEFVAKYLAAYPAKKLDEDLQVVLENVITCLDVLLEKMDLASAQAVEQKFNSSEDFIEPEDDKTRQIFYDAAKQYLAYKAEEEAGTPIGKAAGILAAIKAPADKSPFRFYTEKFRTAESSVQTLVTWLSNRETAAKDISDLSEMLAAGKGSDKELLKLRFPPPVFRNFVNNKLA